MRKLLSLCFAALLIGSAQAQVGLTGGGPFGPSAFTPSVACGTGTITTLGTVAGSFIKTGRLVYVEVTVSITTIGNCAVNIQIGLPSTALPAATAADFLSGREQAVNGKGLVGNVFSTGSMTVWYADGTVPNASGVTLNLSGFYISAN